MAAPTNAPTTREIQYGTTFGHGNLRRTANARVTAGFRWAPLTPPATYTPKTTANAQPQVSSSQSPAARKIVVGVSARPEPGSAATAIATTPSPNMISTAVPRNSARQSPNRPPRRLSPLPLSSGVMTSVIPHLL